MNLNGAFIITGAGRGLGANISHHVYKRGHPTAMIARTKTDLERVAGKIKTANRDKTNKLSYHVADLTSEDDVKRAFDEIRQQHSNIRALINNAGTWTGGKKVEELSCEELQRSLDLNFFSAFNATKEALRLYRETDGDELSIINIGATASVRANASMAAFAIAKGALRFLSQSLAKELGPDGVHVAHLVIDGLINNDRTVDLNPGRPEDKFIEMDHLANEIIRIALQDKCCWTFEWDVRPYNENW